MKNLFPILFLLSLTNFVIGQVSFTTKQLNGCTLPMNIVFTNTSTVGYSYHWDFGDGTTHIGKNVQHTYTVSNDYNVELDAYDKSGNFIGSDIEDISVYAFVLDASQDSVCPDDIINFSIENPYYTITSAFWNFGDGDTLSNTGDQQHSYGTLGKKNVTLTLTSSECGVTNLFDTINVKNNLPITGTIDWSVSPTIVCPGDYVNFDNYSNTNATSYLWNFGDGSNSIYQSDQHTYSVPGTYPVSLTLTNNCGMDTIIYNTIQVKNNLPITGDIEWSVNPNIVCPGDNVYFDNYSNTNAISYLWNFGDGSNSIYQSDQHTYSVPGTYPVSLTLTNNCGMDTIVYDTIQVKNNLPITGYFDWSINPTIVCPGDNISFNSDISNTNATSYLWNFGDGTKTTSSYPNHIYSTQGTYPVSLKLINNCGMDTIVYDTVYVKDNLPFTSYIDWSINPSIVCPGDNVSFNINTIAASYLWNFGDGTNPTSYNNPIHVYSNAGNYPVSLKLTNNCGMDTIVYDTVHVINNLPITGYIDWFINPTIVCPGDNVSFNNNNINNNATSCLWNFGDGTNSILQNPQHSYTTPGAYPVTLKLINNCGMDTIVYDTVQVINNLPITGYIDWFIYPRMVCPGDSVSFMNNSNTNATSCLWNFGDGTNSILQNPQHSYSIPGTYPVTLKLANGCGMDTIVYDTVQVINNLPITGYFNWVINPTPVCPGDNVYFEVDPVAHSYLWNFGDGATSTSYYSNHIYSTPGTYPVTLKLTNGCGMDSIVYGTEQVKNNLQFNSIINVYIAPSLSVCPGDNISFFVDVTAASYLWNFGDGINSILQNPQHSYSSTGTYPVSLTLTNNCGMDTIVYDTIQVKNNLPFSNNYLDWGFTPRTICPGSYVSFDAYTTAHSYLWNFGDGTNSTLQYVNHKYNNLGTMTVSLTLTNNCMNDTTVSDIVIVQDNAKPDSTEYTYGFLNTSGWGSNKDTICPNDTVIIYFYPSGIGTYLINFGDGSSSTTATPINYDQVTLDIFKHKYSSTGMYKISITLTNNCGNSITEYLYGYVTDHGLEFVQISSVDGNYCKGSNQVFTGNGASIYQWNFGDETPVITSYATYNVEHSYLFAGTYTISLTGSNSCGDSKTVTNKILIENCTNNITEIGKSDNITVFPNPTSNQFTIEFDHLTGSYNLEILNTIGQIVLSKNITNKVEQVDLYGQAAGVYFVKLQTESNTVVKKIIKQ